MKPVYISLEGPDGSGTTSHCSLLYNALRNSERKVVLTNEPTSGPIGSFIRQSLQAKLGLPASALQLLFCADRAAHDAKVVRPALERNETVISDRCYLSTLAYGEALGLDVPWLEQVNNAFRKPDLMILALPPLSVCLERLNIRPSRDELEEDSLQARIHKAYHKMAEENPSWIVVDTSGPLEETARIILEHVNKFLERVG